MHAIMLVFEGTFYPLIGPAKASSNPTNMTKHKIMVTYLKHQNQHILNTKTNIP